MNAIEKERERNFVKAVRPLLAKVTTAELMARIRAFRRLPRAILHDAALADAISNIAMIDTGDGKRTAMRFRELRFRKGERFFRALSVPTGHVPPELGVRLDHADAAPEWRVSRPGRVNKVGEPLLYTAVGNPLTTLHECRVPAGDHAVIFGYEARRLVKSPLIGSVETSELLTEEERDKLNLINDFYYDEFSREVEPGLEHLYRVSEIIAKWFFDHPPPFQDCWVYPSTKARGELCAVFRPGKARDCLKLLGAMVVRRGEDGSASVLAVGKPNDPMIDYQRFRPEARSLFPEIDAVGILRS